MKNYLEVTMADMVKFCSTSTLTRLEVALVNISAHRMGIGTERGFLYYSLNYDALSGDEYEATTKLIKAMDKVYDHVAAIETMVEAEISKRPPRKDPHDERCIWCDL